MVNSEDDVIPGVYPTTQEDLEEYAFAGVKQKFEGIVTPNNTNVNKNNISVVYKVYDNNNALLDTLNSTTDSNGKHTLQYTFPKKGNYTIIASVGDDTFSLPINVKSLVNTVSISSSSSSVVAGNTVNLEAVVMSSVEHTVEGADVVFEVTENIDSFTEEKIINDFSELDYDVHLPKINLECKLKGQLGVSIIPKNSSTESQIYQLSSDYYRTFNLIDDGTSLKYYVDDVLKGTLPTGIKKLYIWGEGAVKELTFTGNDTVTAHSTYTSGETSVNYTYPGGTCTVKAIASYGIDSNESRSITITEASALFDEITVTSDKDIISYNGGNNPESATLSAQLTLDDEPVAVSGETVTFEVRKKSDDSLVETLTGSTNSSGLASVSYYGKGTGDLYIQAFSESIIVSKTFTVQDCLLYRPNPVTCTSCNIDLPSSALISFKMSKPRVDGAYGGINLQLIDSSHTYFVGNWSSQGNNGLLIRNTGSSTNLVSQNCSDITANTEYTLGVTYDNGDWTYFKDDEVKSFSENYTPTKLNIIQVQQGTIKDLMIKPL